jgi:hypothetical protein
MSVRFVCQSCWSITYIDDSMAGKRAKCPECHGISPCRPGREHQGLDLN